MPIFPSGNMSQLLAQTGRAKGFKNLKERGEQARDEEILRIHEELEELGSPIHESLSLFPKDSPVADLLSRTRKAIKRLRYGEKIAGINKEAFLRGFLDKITGTSKWNPLNLQLKDLQPTWVGDKILQYPGRAGIASGLAGALGLGALGYALGDEEGLMWGAGLGGLGSGLLGGLGSKWSRDTARSYATQNAYKNYSPAEAAKARGDSAELARHSKEYGEMMYPRRGLFF